jgi:GWxTD domain-containing protein
MTRAARLRKLLTLSLLLLFASPSFPSAYAQEPTPAHNDPYKKWLNEDVRWIITDQERADFKNLSTDEQRDKFVVGFWARRNPTPSAPENTVKEEHYRRLAYANQHFAEGIPGWKADRGRIYIMYGPPDKTDSYPDTTGLGHAPHPEGIPEHHFAFEDWHYRYIAGVGQDVIIEFVDTCECGQYHMTLRRPSGDRP